jgi:hypothetical protein
MENQQMTPPAGQRWTKRKPTEPGWYWWRFRVGKDPVAMKIGDDHIAKTNVFTIGTSVLLIDELPGEWQGPITPNEATE